MIDAPGQCHQNSPWKWTTVNTPASASDYSHESSKLLFDTPRNPEKHHIPGTATAIRINAPSESASKSKLIIQP